MSDGEQQVSRTFYYNQTLACCNCVPSFCFLVAGSTGAGASDWGGREDGPGDLGRGQGCGVGSGRSHPVHKVCTHQNTLVRLLVPWTVQPFAGYVCVRVQVVRDLPRGDGTLLVLQGEP